VFEKKVHFKNDRHERMSNPFAFQKKVWAENKEQVDSSKSFDISKVSLVAHLMLVFHYKSG